MEPASANIVIRESTSLAPGKPIHSSALTVERNAPQLKRKINPVEDSEVTVDVTTSKVQKEEIVNLLNEFSECTYRHLAELGRTS